MSRTMRVRLGGGGTAVVVVGVLVLVASGALLDPGRLGQVVPVPRPAGAIPPTAGEGPHDALPTDEAASSAPAVQSAGPPAGQSDGQSAAGVPADGRPPEGRPPAGRRPAAPPLTTEPGRAATAVAPPPTLTPARLTPAPAPADLASMPELAWGDEGAAVSLLQARLAALGFRATETDGAFGAGTWSAVLAFQKFEGLERTGSVTAEVWPRLYSPQGWLPPPQRTTAPKVEVDLDRQVLFVLNADHPGQVAILNTSTGGGYYYTNEDGSIDFAYTPEGHFNVYRRYDGFEVAPLGTLYRPLYFIGGWAVHGSPSVPEYPASHGCVRLSNDDADWLWDRAPDDLAVSVRQTMDPAVLHQQAWEEWVGSMAEAPTMSGA